MNRVMFSKGTTKSQGDPPQAEANPAQQQRFEQAMRLEQEQHGQLRQRKQAVQNKSALDATLQHERMASDTLQQARLKPPAIKGDKPEPSVISPTTQQTRERQEESDKTEPQAETPALTAQAHLAAEGSPLPAQEHARLTPTPARTPKEAMPMKKEADAGQPHAPHTAADQPVAKRELVGGNRPSASGDLLLADAVQPHDLQMTADQPVAERGLAGGNRPSASGDLLLADAGQPHDQQMTADQPVVERGLAGSNSLHASGDLLLADARELTERLASGTDTDALTVTDEMPEANGQPILPQVKTPGDLLLARIAPAEHPRELGQLLERLAVDIYQELGRPERPPLLRLTLPQLGELSIRIAHQGGELQIEILATSEGQLLLNQGRSDLVDRLQRLYPGERVALALFNQADSEQGSRHKRSIYEEWDADA